MKNKYAQSIGVCTHFESRNNGWKVEKLLPLIKSCGIKAVRQEIHWDRVEKEKGVFKIPDVSMDWVDRVCAEGMGIVMLLCYGNSLYENPLDPVAFARYAKFMAKELKGKSVIAYEIWNEPTNFHFFTQYGGKWSGDDPSKWREEFCKLLELASAAIRESDPDATIISNTGESQFFHMASKSPDSLKLLDGVSHHPYCVRFPPETVAFGGGEISAADGVACADDEHSYLSLFDMTRAHAQKCLGRPFRVFATEFGFSSFNHSRKPGWFYGYTERTQAAYLVRSLALAFAAGVETPCVYDFMNDGVDPEDAEHNLGLVRNEVQGYEPKPAYLAVQRLAEWLGTSSEFLKEAPATLDVELNPYRPTLSWQRIPQEPFLKIDGPQCLWFKRGGDYVSLVWKAGRMEGELNPPMGKIIWEHPPKIKPVRTQNLVSGKELPIRIEVPRRSGQYGMRLILADLPVSGDIVATLWSPCE